MDLMGDIGNADQLIAAREENKVLKAKVDELSLKVKELTITNATLLAEVEMYRKEAALPTFSKLALGEASKTTTSNDDLSMTTDEFITSGNGTYPSDPTVTLPNLHSFLNPLCCALNNTDSILATGGADGTIRLTAWGKALSPTEGAVATTVSDAASVKCNAPVICISFCGAEDMVAAGCMDGSVYLLRFSLGVGGRVVAKELKCVNGGMIKHSKYIKFISWSPSAPIVTTASADGTVQINKISFVDDSMNDDDDVEEETNKITIDKIQSLHLKGAAEAGCFLDDGDTLCLYERDTPYLSYFDLKDECKLTKRSLNGSVTGGFDEHVSFAIMHLCPSPNGEYLCAATDSSRNIVIKAGTDKIVRDLYGHKNDGFSQPRVAWSRNSQYVFGNTQEDNSVCVWDVASAEIVRRMDDKNCNGHKGQLRDIFSSKTSDTLVTASYDKTVKVWLNAM